jgi:pyridoxine 5'-phosphate synthase
MKKQAEGILLGVNIDHIATIRQARHTRYPDPVEAVYASELAGADGITVHLREDRRHIQERDIEIIQQVLLTRLNLEMAVTDTMLKYAEKIRPEHCCLVPEKREELTTEGGLNVLSDVRVLQKLILMFHYLLIRISNKSQQLFVLARQQLKSTRASMLMQKPKLSAIMNSSALSRQSILLVRKVLWSMRVMV